MKYIILIFVLMFSISLNAQDVKKEGKTIAETLKLKENVSSKEAKKLEKGKNKAEKAQKRDQDRLDSATKRLKSSQKKYDRLKRKGKLSPKQEAKWLKKLEGYQEDLKRAKRKV
ncbi:hypothetical protein [Psychroserpens jangbogonensis]|uniref:hypothetical protein n=1 Tax=Psychroserpens jangbogonensis TaxID=1484460 RepID=UPI00126A485C|nr:hypothetical protein [Psychroserpens jangbogonensis]